MSEPEGPEGPAGNVSSTAPFLNLIQRQVRESEEELLEGEFLRMVVCTPEGRMQALKLECVDPNVLVVYEIRGGRPTTLIASIESPQVSIERVPLPPEEKPRYHASPAVNANDNVGAYRRGSTSSRSRTRKSARRRLP